MNDTFEDTGAVELTVLDDDALDNVTGGLLNRSFVADANGGIPIGTPIALLFIAAALIFLPAIFEVDAGTTEGPQSDPYISPNDGSLWSPVKPEEYFVV